MIKGGLPDRGIVQIANMSTTEDITSRRRNRRGKTRIEPERGDYVNCSYNFKNSCRLVRYSNPGAR